MLATLVQFCNRVSSFHILLLGSLLLCIASPAFGQEVWSPTDLKSEQTEINVWTSADITYARVKVTFADSGYRIADWGRLSISGDHLSVDIKTEVLTGPFLVVPTEFDVQQVYQLGVLPTGTYSFAVNSRGTPVKTQQFDRDQTVEHWEAVTLTADQVGIAISTAGGTSFAYVSLYFADIVYRVDDWGSITKNGNDFFVDIKVERWIGAPTSKNGATQHFLLGPTPPGIYSVNVYSHGELARNQPFNPANQQSGYANPIEHPSFFVRQQYLDFLNREPESGGLTFWDGQFQGPCGINSNPCFLTTRNKISAAFFQSSEFQQTGSFVYRMYIASLGRQPNYAEFSTDQSQIVAGPNLDASKAAFAEAWVKRAAFVDKYGPNPAPDTFVDALLATLTAYDGVDLSLKRVTYIAQSENGFTLGRIVQEIAEDAAVQSAEYNPSFVLMQYFGFLRRDPDAAGYTFWLNVLNNKDPNNYEGMVCSFITSREYQLRFGATVIRTNQQCQAGTAATPTPSPTPKPTPTPTPTPLPTPPPAPAGGKIAFLSNRDHAEISQYAFEIYSMNVDGSGQTRLTIDAYGGIAPPFPIWSPDGTRIAFQHYGPGFELFVMKADGTALTHIPIPPGYEANPAWSPDSKKIAFPRLGGIYVANADGSAATQLTFSTSDAGPLWSPDGSKIAFARTINNQSDIFVMNADGTNQKNITNSTENESLGGWSPDGRRLIFNRTMGTNDWDIFVVDADGTNLVNLTNNSAFDWMGQWSPNGKQILFESYRSGTSQIYVMNPDGTSLTRLTNNSAYDDWARWSPDGLKIVFTSNRDGNSEIYVMNNDGSNQVRLTNNGTNDTVPRWQPLPPS